MSLWMLRLFFSADEAHHIFNLYKRTWCLFCRSSLWQFSNVTESLCLWTLSVLFSADETLHIFSLHKRLCCALKCFETYCRVLKRWEKYWLCCTLKTEAKEHSSRTQWLVSLQIPARAAFPLQARYFNYFLFFKDTVNSPWCYFYRNSLFCLIIINVNIPRETCLCFVRFLIYYLIFIISWFISIYFISLFILSLCIHLKTTCAQSPVLTQPFGEVA